MRHLILQLAPALALVFVVVMRRAERRLVRRLRAASATSAERALSLGARRSVTALKLRRMMQGGAVREAGSGRYYLDEPGYASYRASRRRRALVVIAAALGVALGAYFWQARS